MFVHNVLHVICICDGEANGNEPVPASTQAGSASPRPAPLRRPMAVCVERPRLIAGHVARSRVYLRRGGRT